MAWVRLGLQIALPVALLGAVLLGFVWWTTPVDPVNYAYPSYTRKIRSTPVPMGTVPRPPPIPQPQPTMTVIPRYFETPCIPYWQLWDSPCPPRGVHSPSHNAK
jgi:hypothetical protein